MRKNTPLSTYIRGIAFLDARVKEADASIVQEMTYFDLHAFQPILALADTCYVAKLSLDEKLSKLIEDFNAKDSKSLPLHQRASSGRPYLSSGKTEERKLANLLDLRT